MHAPDLNSPSPDSISDPLAARIESLSCDRLAERYREQNEFLVIENFLPEPLLRECQATLPALQPFINRNFIPRHKKGGSVSRFDLDRQAPVFGRIYRHGSLHGFLQQLTGAILQSCPADDPHTYALYDYSQAGDHIGFHYDRSYYAGSRYTVLLGLIDDSSCKLECALYHGLPDRKPELLALGLAPGTLVVFNGDKLYHRVTPIGANERRVVLTLEYLTDTEMHPVLRFVSNMKDAIGYFGFRQVFGAKSCAQ